MTFGTKWVLTLVVCAFLPAVGACQDKPDFGGHRLGETKEEFVKIEAPRNGIDTQKCDYIGRDWKRELCDRFVDMLANPSKDSAVQLKANGIDFESWFKGNSLTRVWVPEHAGATNFQTQLKNLTAQYGKPSILQISDLVASDVSSSQLMSSRFNCQRQSFAGWYVEPHRSIAMMAGSCFPSQVQLLYMYVDASPIWSDPPWSFETTRKLLLNEAQATAIKDAVAMNTPWSVFENPKVRQKIAEVFGRDFAYPFYSEPVWSGSIEGSIAVLTFCPAHSCGSDESIFTIDLKTGACAGEREYNGLTVVHRGDYESDSDLPKALQQ